MGILRFVVSLLLINLIVFLVGCGGSGNSTPQLGTDAITNGSQAAVPLPTAGMPFPPSPLVMLNASEVSQPLPQDIVEANGIGRSVSDSSLTVADPFGPQSVATTQFNRYSYLMSGSWFDAQRPWVYSEVHVWGAVTSSNLPTGVYAEIGLVNQATDLLAARIPYQRFYQNVGMLVQNQVLSACDTAGSLTQSATTASAFDFDLKLSPVGGGGGSCQLRVRPRTLPIQPWSGWTSVQNYGNYDYSLGELAPPWPTTTESLSSAQIIAQIYSNTPLPTAGNINFRYVRQVDGTLTAPAVDCHFLSNARFAIVDPVDGVAGGSDQMLSGWMTTNTPTPAGTQIESCLYLGQDFYVMFSNDPAQTADKALYPQIPDPGIVTYTTAGLMASPSLAAYFDLPDTAPLAGRVYNAAHPFVLTLRDGAYNRIRNDLHNLAWAQYQIKGRKDPADPEENITGLYDTNTSASDRVILRTGVRYTPYFYNLNYPEVGADTNPGFVGASEKIYPQAVPEAPGYILVQYNTVGEVPATPLGPTYYDDILDKDANWENPNDHAIKHWLILRADAFCRFELRPGWQPNLPLYGLIKAASQDWIIPATLNSDAQPFNTVALLRDTSFCIKTSDGSLSQIIIPVSVPPADPLDRAVSLIKIGNEDPAYSVPFTATGGGGTYSGTLDVLPLPVSNHYAWPPVRVFDDPEETNPDQLVTLTEDGWDVDLRFVLQYGTAPYTVELDGDYNPLLPFGDSGRVYDVLDQEYTPAHATFDSNGPKESIVSIPRLTQPAGTYTFALRVTDARNAEYIYDLWPQVTLSDPEPLYGDWSMFGHDARHTHCSSYYGPLDDNILWDCTVGGVVTTSPAMASDGTIYVGTMVYAGSGANEITAINPDGSIKWTYTASSWLYGSSPAVGADGTIYIGSLNGTFYAINADGTLKWTYSMGTTFWSSPVIAEDGTIYMSSEDCNLYALNPDGTLQWEYTMEGGSNSSPAIGNDGTIYVGDAEGYLYAIDSDGSLEWAYTLPGAIYSSPAVATDGTIYIGSNESQAFYAIHPNGSLYWVYSVTDVLYSSPAIGDDGMIYVGSADGNLYAINPDGTYEWSSDVGNEVVSSPAIDAAGNVYVASEDGVMHALDSNGDEIWYMQLGDQSWTSPAIGDDGVLYVSDHAYTVYAFGPES